MLDKIWTTEYQNSDFYIMFLLTTASSPVHGTIVPTAVESSLATSCTEAELVSLAEKVASQRGIQNIPSINDFLTSSSEEVFDNLTTSEEQYLEEVAGLFDGTSNIQNENDKEEDVELSGSGAEFKEVDLNEATAAMKLLIKWQE
ncbi:hypothetical protein K3495_g2871 [Podosphaera aphanis]|nr:hypothetical protein K3495_g2871 [Podosphaera aphanis]